MARLRRLRRLIVGALFCLYLLPVALHAAATVERFPPPEFEPGTYTMPGVTTPPPRAHVMEYVDMALLFLALSLSTWAVHKKRSRQWVFWITASSLLYFGFVRKGCVCPIGSIQDVTLALFHPGYAVPFSVLVFFLLPLLFTLFVGRTFCAAVCPLGAAQDMMVWKPVKLPVWIEHTLGLVPYLYLGAAVLFAATGTAFIICEWDPFVSFFRLSGSFKMLAIGAGFLLVGLFIGRPYCRFFCPYGALLSLLSRVSKRKVELTPDDCIKCQICDVACPFGAIAEPTEAAPPKPPPGSGRFAMLVLVALLLVGAGVWVGRSLAVPLSMMNRTVALAERIAVEDAGGISEPDNASKAFRNTGRSFADLKADALRVREQFRFGGLLLGGFIGLVIGVKLISLSFDEGHDVYEPDRASCLACARCYSYCPKELVRVKRAEKKDASKPAVV